MAGLALHTLTVADETAAFTAFLVAALTIAFVMAALVLAIGLAQAHVVTSMKGSTHTVKRISGLVLLVVGVWLVVLAVWADAFVQILFPA